MNKKITKKPVKKQTPIDESIDEEVEAYLALNGETADGWLNTTRDMVGVDTICEVIAKEYDITITEELRDTVEQRLLNIK